MSQLSPTYSSIDEWIAREAVPFAADSPETFHAAVDRMMEAMGDSIELLGFGEALHGSEDMLGIRNWLFQRLVESHGYTAIAIESSFPRGRLVNEYVAGRGPDSYEVMQENGFSHGFGRARGNRELIEWMRRYNADASHPTKLRFYGFDSPTEMMNTDSPRGLLEFALDFLGPAERRQRIEPLIGPDADWENPAAMMDPTKSIGLSSNATALRIETEDLITELAVRRPELVANSDEGTYLEALQHAKLARQLLSYHAGIAGNSPNRIAELLGLRDLMMADNLAYAVARERGRGKVFVFAHNSHLKRGLARWQLGPNTLEWWPAGSHLNEMMGSRYVVIGSGIGTSEANGIDPPEAGTLEAHFTAPPGPARFIPTHDGQGIATRAISELPTRSNSAKNSTYFPLTGQSFTDFDWLAVVDSIG